MPPKTIGGEGIMIYARPSVRGPLTSISRDALSVLGEGVSIETCHKYSSREKLFKVRG